MFVRGNFIIFFYVIAIRICKNYLLCMYMYDIINVINALSERICLNYEVIGFKYSVVFGI